MQIPATDEDVFRPEPDGRQIGHSDREVSLYRRSDLWACPSKTFGFSWQF